jgi:hypothetical protein
MNQFELWPLQVPLAMGQTLLLVLLSLQACQMQDYNALYANSFILKCGVESFSGTRVYKLNFRVVQLSSVMKNEVQIGFNTDASVL